MVIQLFFRDEHYFFDRVRIISVSSDNRPHYMELWVPLAITSLIMRLPHNSLPVYLYPEQFYTIVQIRIQDLMCVRNQSIKPTEFFVASGLRSLLLEAARYEFHFGDINRLDGCCSFVFMEQKDGHSFHTNHGESVSCDSQPCIYLISRKH